MRVLKRWWWLCWLILASCEAQATPVAQVAIPTPTLAPSPTPVVSLRYGVLANASDLPLLPETLAELMPNASLELGQPEDAMAFDLLIGYGEPPTDEWQRAPARLNLMLSSNVVGFNAEQRNALEAALKSVDLTPALTEVGVQNSPPSSSPGPTLTRLRLARQDGALDGFIVTLAHESLPPSWVIAFEEALQAHNIEARVFAFRRGQQDDVLQAGNVALVLYTAWEENPPPTGASVVVSLPLRYLTQANVTLSPQGLPLVGLPD